MFRRTYLIFLGSPCVNHPPPKHKHKPKRHAQPRPTATHTKHVQVSVEYRRIKTTGVGVDAWRCEVAIHGYNGRVSLVRPQRKVTSRCKLLTLVCAQAQLTDTLEPTTKQGSCYLALFLAQTRELLALPQARRLVRQLCWTWHAPESIRRVLASATPMRFHIIYRTTDSH